MFSTHSRLFPIHYQKTVTTTPDGAIAIDYAITNEGEEAFDCIWAGHIMLKGEDGMRLLTPFAKNAPIETVFATDGYDREDLPRDTLMGFQPNTGAAYKFYYLEPMREGFFGIHYASGKELRFWFDEKKLPYLGVWINNGEFQGIYNVAPEPCTAPFDAPDKAAQKGYFSQIPASSSFAFRITVSMQNHQ